jgi:hypothetical protein
MKHDRTAHFAYVDTTQRQARDGHVIAAVFNRERLAPVEPDLTLNRWTLLAAVVMVAATVVVSWFLKYGFAA